MSSHLRKYAGSLGILVLFLLLGAILFLAYHFYFQSFLDAKTSNATTAPPTSLGIASTTTCFEIKNGSVYDSFGITVPGADLRSFQVLTPQSSQNTQDGSQNACYAKDKSHVWFDTRLTSSVIVPDADPASFHTFPYVVGIAADTTHVYVENAPVDGADASTFTVLSSGYAKDKNAVYLIDDSDNGEGKSLGSEILKPMVGADSATFVAFNEDYGKDVHGIWYDGLLFSNADADTFQVLGYGYAKDAQYAYFGTTTEAVDDPASFTPVISSQLYNSFGTPYVIYTKDKYHVYENEYSQSGETVLSPLQGIDQATFKVLHVEDDYLTYSAMIKDKSAGHIPPLSRTPHRSL